MDETQLKAQVNQYIDDNAEEMVDFLGDLVSQKTVTGNELPAQEVVIEKFKSMELTPEAWCPDAKELRDHPAFFETQPFQEHGYENRPNVNATIEGSGDSRSLVLSGHVDVVPVTESEWEHDPWTMEQEGDRVYGRGTGDMKGGIAAYVHAVEALHAIGVDLAGDLILQTTIEEEDGGVGGVLAALERGYQPDGAIIAEPWSVPNMGMASAGVHYFELTVHGKSAHVGYGYEGMNALDKAMAIYEALRELDAERKARIDYPPAYRLEPEMKGWETNLNVGIIEAANWPAIIPGEVRMQGRIGWPPGESKVEIRKELTSAIDAVVEKDDWLRENPPTLEWIGLQVEPHEVSPEEPLLQTAMANAEAVTGREGIFYGGSAGNDTRYYKRYYDIPVTSVGPDAVDIHGADEHTTVTSLRETAKTLACTVIDYCGVAK